MEEGKQVKGKPKFRTQTKVVLWVLGVLLVMGVTATHFVAKDASEISDARRASEG